MLCRPFAYIHYPRVCKPGGHFFIRPPRVDIDLLARGVVEDKYRTNSAPFDGMFHRHCDRVKRTGCYAVVPVKARPGMRERVCHVDIPA